eukprot:m.109410 g.109410  ORF g.109410 m.109410 type:complete len:676 (+) comp9039_c1_seq2:13-2040(+)
MAAAAGGSRAMFWKPGESAPRIQAERSSETELDMVPHNTNAAYSLSQQRARLPIFKYRENILHLLEQHTTLVLVGETGCGKSTQIPQYLYEAGWAAEGRIVACLQPRRVAAISVATRVAEEMHARLGDVVGYSIRFDDCYSAERTSIKYMTDGMLVRELLSDRALKAYSIVVLDEAHERSLHTDVLFGLIKDILRRRADLKVVIMSATLEAQQFSVFFGQAPVLYVAGRQHPIDIFYTAEPVSDYLDAAMVAVLQIHQSAPPTGDILVFLTGQEEIESMEALLEECAKNVPAGLPALAVCSLYGALAPQEQMRVFAPAAPGTRKVILATNIAETSITINGIVHVVDCGLVKQRWYAPSTGLDLLGVRSISKAQARQRAGRAGRESHGMCYRLYTEDSFTALKDSTEPEIVRCNMATAALQLLALGIEDIPSFDFMSPPTDAAIAKALGTLINLEAIDQDGKLTSLGRKMAQFPLDPPYSRALLSAGTYHCSEELISLIALLSVDSIFFIPTKLREKAEKSRRKFFVSDGDHGTLLNIFKSYLAEKNKKQWCYDNFVNFRVMATVVDVRAQLRELCQRADVPLASCGSDTEAYRRCLLTGMFHNVALLQQDGQYKVMRSGQLAYIHPSSVLSGQKPSCILFNEVVQTTKRYMRDCCIVDMDWLAQCAPKFFRKATQ